ncbi:myocilin [Lampetra fluviatilis]
MGNQHHHHDPLNFAVLLIVTIIATVPAPCCCQTEGQAVAAAATAATPSANSPDAERRCVYSFAVASAPDVRCAAAPDSAELAGILRRLSRLESAVIGRVRPDDHDGSHGERDGERDREREDRERDREDRERDRHRDARGERREFQRESLQNDRDRMQRDRDVMQNQMERMQRDSESLQKDRDRLHADKLQLARENAELEKRVVVLTAEAALLRAKSNLRRGPDTHVTTVLQRMGYEEARAGHLKVQPFAAHATGASEPWVWAVEPTAVPDFIQQGAQDRQSGQMENSGCGVVVGVSEPETRRTAEGLDGKYGAWMRDPRPVEPFRPGLVWALFTVGSNVRQLFEYEDDEGFRKGYPRKVYALPYAVASTGAVVLSNCLYYQRRNSRRLLRYDMTAETVLAERDLEGAGYHGHYPYSWGGYTDIDLAVDEEGLWAIYSTAADRGEIVLASLDPQSLKVTRRFEVRGVRKSSVANAFVACGRLYTLSSYAQRRSALNHVFDTRTRSLASIAVPFTNRYQYLAMLAYNPSERRLYAWDNYNMVTYNLTFA